MGGKKQSSTQQRERENEAKVGRSRQADVFGLDRGAGGETLGPEGRRSMMSLPNRVIYNVIGKRAEHCNRAAHPRRSLAIISSQAV